MNLQKLVSSESSYQKLIQKTLESIGHESDQENVLRNIVLFCKQVFSSNANQRKKYLCLLLIKDIFESVNSEYFEKLVDEYLALKIQQIVQIYVENRGKQSRTGNEDKLSSQRLFDFAVETVVFWAKRLSFLPKSTFAQVYDEQKKMKISPLQQFHYYKKEMLVQLWKSGEHGNQISEKSNEIVQKLNSNFKECKDQIEATINESVLNDDEVLLKPIIEKLRDFLLFFLSKYRELQEEETEQRDVVIVYYHILNNLYKKVCNRIYISIQEMISLTKEAFQAIYPPDYDSIDRMDIIELAGVVKFNALTIFQRIHQKIEKEDALLGPFKLSISLQPTEPPHLQLEGSLAQSRSFRPSSFSKSQQS